MARDTSLSETPRIYSWEDAKAEKMTVFIQHGRKNDMINKNFRYFSIAKEVSHLSKMERIKIGAVIVKKHHILGKGTNIKKSHPLQKKFNRFRAKFSKHHNYLHAETDAVLHSDRKELNGASIYLYREKRRWTSCYVPPVRGVYDTSSVSRD